MALNATYDGRVFVPDRPVDLPVGRRVQVNLDLAADSIAPLSGLDEALQNLPENLDAPTDRAANVDRYLYGTPKRP